MLIETYEYKTERIFLFISILIGLLLVFVTPPMAVPDENTHFVNAYAFSKGIFFPDVVNGQVGIRISKTIVDLIDTNKDKFTGFENRQNYKQFYLDSWFEQDPTEMVFYVSQRTINPIGYIVSGIGMAFGSFISKPFSVNTPYNLLLFGRIFNLMFYIYITYWAIKITPFYKRTMLLLSLMPMSIFLAASLSYDAIIIPVCFLLFSYWYKFICFPEGGIFSKQDILVVILLSVFIGGIKSAYIPLLLILFSIPKARFKNTKNFSIVMVLIIFCTLAAYFIPFFLKLISNGGDIISKYDEYVILQKDFLANHITLIPSILFNTIRDLRTYYLSSIFGNLGNLDTNFPFPLVIMYYLFFALVNIIDACEAGYLSWKYKISSISSVFIVVVGMYYYMYIYWTSIPAIVGVGANYVSGIQGRYFIPLILFVVILFSNSLIKRKFPNFIKKITEKFHYFIRIIPLMYGFQTIIILLMRYWF